ncbi:MAG: nucleotidyltransferase domain-containing protein [Planctomycetota bacterium]
MKTLALRDKDLAVLRRTFHRFPCVREVRLFGSRATGHASRTSDIDFAISAPDATADQWLELTDALDEIPIIYEFDVVRIEHTHSSRLLEKIAREGVPIYPESLNSSITSLQQ